MKQFLTLTAFLLIALVPMAYAQNGIITKFAGNGTGGDGGPALTAQLASPVGLATDNNGRVFIADRDHYRVRMVDTSGIITTLAGNGTPGYSGDGGPATAAQLDSICGVAYDPSSGCIYIACSNVVRKVDAGTITTMAGTGIPGYSGDGGLATDAQLNGASRLAVGHYGINIYILDVNNNRIRVIDPSGTITTLVGTGIAGFNGDGLLGPATQIDHPAGIWALPGTQGVIFSDAGNNRVRYINLSGSGTVRTLAGNGIAGFSGDGHMATDAQLDHPGDLAIDNAYHLYIVDVNNNRIRKMDGMFGGTVATIAGNGVAATGFTGYPIGTPMIPFALTVDTSNNNIYTADGASLVLSTKIFPVTGTFYFDANNNCVKDSTERDINIAVTISVDSNGMAVDTISAAGGFNYYARGHYGDIYTFKIIPPAGLITSCLASSTFYDTIGRQNNFTMQIGFRYDSILCSASTAYDLSVAAGTSHSGIHRHEANLFIEDIGCDSTTAVVAVHFDSNYAYAEAWPPPLLYTSNTITWAFPCSNISFLPTQLWYHLEALSYFPVGQKVHDTVSVSPMSGDTNPGNNYMIITDTIKGGWDPNEMIVSPAACVLSGSQLKYTIGFENTGNDTAFNIYVIDSLDNNVVDPQSFRIVSASAAMTTSRIYSGGYSIIQFAFPNINLLDSSNHGLCDGMVTYTINTKSGLPDGTGIFNRAGIYFDSNPVVETNTVENLTGCTVAHTASISDKHEVKIFPNPADDELNIVSENGSYTSFTITNSIGSTILQQAITGPKTTIKIKTLPAGLYCITLYSVDRVKVEKFIKG